MASSTPFVSEMAYPDFFSDIPPEVLSQTLSNPPFISVPGTFNVRDVGLSAQNLLRPGLVFRAGVLSGVGDAGKEVLRTKLGIVCIVDLRVKKERSAQPPPDIPGADVLWTPPEREAATIDFASFINSADGVENGYAEMYMDMLESYAPSYKRTLEYLRDNPDQPILFHCTAGKDRTGVLAAIILSLSEAPDEIIAQDYTLTRFGIEPEKAALIAFVKKANPTWTEDAPGVREFSSIKASYMLAFLKAMRKEYGDVEGYLRRKLCFTSSDIERIKENLRSKEAQQGAKRASEPQ